MEVWESDVYSLCSLHPVRWYRLKTNENMLLIWQAFEQELKKRKSNIDSIQKAAKDVMERSDEDTSLLQAQLIDLTTKWDKVSSLSVNKRQCLTDAYAEVWSQ